MGFPTTHLLRTGSHGTLCWSEVLGMTLNHQSVDFPDFLSKYLPLSAPCVPARVGTGLPRPQEIRTGGGSQVGSPGDAWSSFLPHIAFLDSPAAALVLWEEHGSRRTRGMPFAKSGSFLSLGIGHPEDSPCSGATLLGLFTRSSSLGTVHLREPVCSSGMRRCSALSLEPALWEHCSWR